jgi:hypothetical protein
VGEHHLGDGFGIDAGGLQISGKPAIGRLILVARADVDDDQVVFLTDDRDVGLGFDKSRLWYCRSVAGFRCALLAIPQERQCRSEP